MKTRFLRAFGIFLVMLSAVNYAYGLWIPQSPQQLFEQSQTVFVGTIQSINVLKFERSNEYHVEENGVSKIIVENYTQTLDEYTVSIEEFLKNPQKSNTITMLEATVGGVPGRSVSIGGFELGDRVLFYVPKLDGTNQYSPESFLIPENCDAKSVLEQPRIIGSNDFRIMQEGITRQDNFTANKKIQFVFDKDMRTLDGAGFNVDVTISKILDKNERQTILDENIHVESQPCEWIATAQWDFVPTAGEYAMWMSYHQDGDTGYTTGSSHFSVVEESESQIRILDGTPFFISKPYEAKQNSQEIILFHGVNFTYPSHPEIPNPSGFVSTTIAFDDGTKESLSIGFTPKPLPSIAKHNNVQAGMIRDSDGLYLIVSADLSKISPLKQFKSGIPFDEIQCKEGLFLIQKYDGTPACVTPETKTKLIERGWAKPDIRA